MACSGGSPRYRELRSFLAQAGAPHSGRVGQIEDHTVRDGSISSGCLGSDGMLPRVVVLPPDPLPIELLEEPLALDGVEDIAEKTSGPKKAAAPPVQQRAHATRVMAATALFDR